MGWSCTKAAADTRQTWEDACRESTGSQNQWIDDNGNTYFYEISNKEHRDGAITGTIYRENGNTCTRSSSFRIEGDGTVARAPMFLKRAAEKAGRKVA